MLITRLSSFGDIVHTWPLAVALRAAMPAAEIAWVVEEELLPLVESHPDVARPIAVATRRWRRAPLSAATRREMAATRGAITEFAPAVALDPQGLVKSAVWAWRGGVPRRIGLGARWRREWPAGLFYTDAVTPPEGARHVVDLNLSLLTALGLEPAYGAAPDAGFLLAGAQRPGEAVTDRPAPAPVVLLPGSAKAGKRWCVAGFAEIGGRLAAAGRRVVVAWGPGEEALAAAVAGAAGPGVEVAPATGIRELAALLAAAEAVVGGDTGPTHLAAALGRPTVALYLATDPERNAPRGPHVNVVTAARGGAGRGRARTVNDGEVAAEEVLRALAPLVYVGDREARRIS